MIPMFRVFSRGKLRGMILSCRTGVREMRNG
jgi:hypothetical protein